MKFILEFFALITGIGAASGLYLKDDNLYIISDDSNYLYEYRIDSQQLEKHLLFDMPQNERVAKKEKLDLEAITYYEDMFFLFSSGSRPNRTKSFNFVREDLPLIHQLDMTQGYQYFQEQLGISPEDFNIEGALFYLDTLLLFNRGNGPGAVNGIIKVAEHQCTPPTFTPVQLPTIDGQPTGFTDATLVGDKIYFLATAEGGGSSYADGEIGGSQVGVINLSDLRLEQVETLSTEYKFEGITLYRSDANEISFLLCEDPDDNSRESTIYQLKIRK